ncbi:MAG: hypothetical protein RIC56_21190 [Pseudomonadales bacterium]
MIGVTGHRDLVEAEEPLLERAVEAFFRDLSARFQDLPLLVTTPLAEGADRLVARVAQRLGIPLNILLPMPREIYQNDFVGASAAVFDEMLALGEVIELPLLEDVRQADDSITPIARDAQYEYLGIYLAAHSHVLLAIWDGKASPAPGGTAQVVRFHQENVVHLISGVGVRSAIDFSEDESDLAYHIACSRVSAGPPLAGLSPGEAAWLTRDDLQPRTSAMPQRYVEVFQQQERLNRDLQVAGLPADADGLLPAEADASVAADIGGLATAVDSLAVRFQRRALRTLRTLYVLAALTGISFIVYADFPDQDAMIWAYLLLLALGYTLYLLERRGAWYRRYVDYRGLAEGLRVQGYWAMAGVHMEVPTEFAHDRYMRREELSLGWIRNVMRFAGRRSDAATADAPPAALGRVIQHWIDSEHDYYQRRFREHVEHIRNIGRLSVAGFATGLAAAGVLALFQHSMSDASANILIAVMVGLPFIATVRASYAERICERELVAQFAHMARIYANAHRLLKTTEDAAEQRGILRALGEEALQEIGQWVLRQRERPVSGDQLFRTG